MEIKNTDPSEIFEEFDEKIDQNLMIEHDYDGIKELDNPPPPWLMWLFYITVMWSVGYAGYYHWFSVGDLQAAEYEKVMEEAAEKYKTQAMDNESLVLLTSEKDLAAGAEIYSKSCVACHGSEGQGGIGSNLTDSEWIYGNEVKNVFETIKNGTDKGMTSFKSLGDENILKVTSYVLTKFK